MLCIGVWLSLVERYVRDVEAAGSNPVTPIDPPQTSGLRHFYCKKPLIPKIGQGFFFCRFFSAAHIQKGVRIPLLIQISSFVNRKSHMLIKTNGLWILLIDCYPFYLFITLSPFQQLFPNPFPRSADAMKSISKDPFSVPINATGCPASVAIYKRATSSMACGT